MQRNFDYFVLLEKNKLKFFECDGKRVILVFSVKIWSKWTPKM